MKRLSVLLLIVLLAGLISGCRYAIIEEDSILVSGWAAHAEGEGAGLFQIDDIDTAFLDNTPPADFTPKPTETPEPTPVPKPTATPDPNATKAPIGLRSRDEDGENAVRKLQSRLEELGYLEVEPDGVFGSRTLRRSSAFRRTTA